jgi:hypothetical protein
VNLTLLFWSHSVPWIPARILQHHRPDWTITEPAKCLLRFRTTATRLDLAKVACHPTSGHTQPPSKGSAENSVAASRQLQSEKAVYKTLSSTTDKRKAPDNPAHQQTMAEPPQKRAKRTDSSTMWGRNDARKVSVERDLRGVDTRPSERDRDRSHRSDQKQGAGLEERRYRSRSRDGNERRRDRSRSRDRERARDGLRQRDGHIRRERVRSRSRSRDRHRSRRGWQNRRPIISPCN